MATLALKYRNFTSFIERKCADARNWLGVADTTETRVFLAVVAGVALFYICYLVCKGNTLFSAASAAFIVHQ